MFNTLIGGGMSVVCNRHQNEDDAEHNHCARSITASARDTLSQDEQVHRLKLRLASGYDVDVTLPNARSLHMDPRKPARNFTERPSERTLRAVLDSGDFTLDQLQCFDA